MNNQSPIVSAIVVTHRLPRGVIARVDGQTRWFRSLDAVFRTALALLDEAVETTVPRERKGP
jgi:hypothetical protein